MLEELKEKVLKANLELPTRNLVLYTWGNASGIDRKKGLVVIKPSGVPYEQLKLEDLVVVNLDGKRIEGKYKSSSDTLTHLVIYKAFPQVGGIVHTHSSWSTIWAQGGKDIPVLGTTHADYFYGDIPCTRRLTAQEINKDYETQTGNVIVERFKTISAEHFPGVLVNNHGPFCWGKDVEEAVRNAVVMEEVSKMAYYTLNLALEIESLDKNLLDRHFLRKHGRDMYYGQG